MRKAGERGTQELLILPLVERTGEEKRTGDLKKGRNMIRCSVRGRRSGGEEGAWEKGKSRFISGVLLLPHNCRARRKDDSLEDTAAGASISAESLT